MNRWAYRILGMLMILVFMLVLLYLQRQLIAIARQRGVKTTTEIVTRVESPRRCG